MLANQTEETHSKRQRIHLSKVAKREGLSMVIVCPSAERVTLTEAKGVTNRGKDGRNCKETKRTRGHAAEQQRDGMDALGAVEARRVLGQRQHAGLGRGVRHAALEPVRAGVAADVDDDAARGLLLLEPVDRHLAREVRPVQVHAEHVVPPVHARVFLAH